MAGQVVTLQIGGLANHAGIHFWNAMTELAYAEDSHVDLYCLFKEVDTGSGRTVHPFKPRAILCDTSGSFASPSMQSPAASRDQIQEQAAATWGGSAQVYTRPEPVLEPPSEDPWHFAEGPFLQYSRAEISSSSMLRLESVWKDVTPFSSYSDGADCCKRAEFADAFQDMIRRELEESDRLSGFQCFVEDVSGFGAAAERLLETVKDEYSRAPVLLYALRSSHRLRSSPRAPFAEALARDCALSLARLAPWCDAYLPAEVPASWSGREISTDFAAGAILAAALAAAAMPWAGGPSSLRAAGRAETASRTDLKAHLEMLTWQGVQLQSLGLVLPRKGEEASEAVSGIRQLIGLEDEANRGTASRALSLTPLNPPSPGSKAVGTRGAVGGGSQAAAPQFPAALGVPMTSHVSWMGSPYENATAVEERVYSKAAGTSAYARHASSMRTNFTAVTAPLPLPPATFPSDLFSLQPPAALALATCVAAGDARWRAHLDSAARLLKLGASGRLGRATMAGLEAYSGDLPEMEESLLSMASRWEDD